MKFTKFMLHNYLNLPDSYDCGILETWSIIYFPKLNSLKTKDRLLYLKTQFVPHSKQF